MWVDLLCWFVCCVVACLSVSGFFRCSSWSRSLSLSQFHRGQQRLASPHTSILAAHVHSNAASSAHDQRPESEASGRRDKREERGDGSSVTLGLSLLLTCSPGCCCSALPCPACSCRPSQLTSIQVATSTIDHTQAGEGEGESSWREEERDSGAWMRAHRLCCCCCSALLCPSFCFSSTFFPTLLCSPLPPRHER